MDHKNDDQALAFDIAMALSRSPLRFKKAQDMDALRNIAAGVVKHLRLCRWKIDRLPPADPH